VSSQTSGRLTLHSRRGLDILQANIPVQRGGVVKELQFPGRIAPAQKELLFFRASGHVRQVNVLCGSKVTAGQVLAESDVTDLENQLNQAGLVLNASRAWASDSTRLYIVTLASCAGHFIHSRYNRLQIILAQGWMHRQRKHLRHRLFGLGQVEVIS